MLDILNSLVMNPRFVLFDLMKYGSILFSLEVLIIHLSTWSFFAKKKMEFL